jgi:hypothetical protein
VKKSHRKLTYTILVFVALIAASLVTHAYIIILDKDNTAQHPLHYWDKTKESFTGKIYGVFPVVIETDEQVNCSGIALARGRVEKVTYIGEKSYTGYHIYQDRMFCTSKTIKNDVLAWKKYSHENLGLSFLYPSRTDSSERCSNPKTVLTVMEKGDSYKHSVAVCKGMGYIIRVENTGETSYTLDEWINQSNLLKGTKTSVNFKGVEAYYYEITDPQQVPMDIYIFKVNGEIHTISFYKPQIRSVFDDYIITKFLDSVEMKE